MKRPEKAVFYFCLQIHALSLINWLVKTPIQLRKGGLIHCPPPLFLLHCAAYHELQGDNLDHIILNEDKIRHNLVRCFEMRN